MGWLFGFTFLILYMSFSESVSTSVVVFLVSGFFWFRRNSSRSALLRSFSAIRLSFALFLSSVSRFIWAACSVCLSTLWTSVSMSLSCVLYLKSFRLTPLRTSDQLHVLTHSPKVCRTVASPILNMRYLRICICT